MTFVYFYIEGEFTLKKKNPTHQCSLLDKLCNSSRTSWDAFFLCDCIMK